MSRVLEELELTLKELDTEQAGELHRELEEVLVRAKARCQVRSNKRRPPDYFERVAGVLKGEEFERPEQLPFEIREPF
jgi:hypothetical protein